MFPGGNFAAQMQRLASDNNDNNNNNNNNNPQVPTNTTFFVVQKCWHAGPHVFDPIDYPRLFPSNEAAQVVAHQSAAAMSAAHQDQHEPVRTIILPHGQYGFAVAGTLFWIRAMAAHVYMTATTTPSTTPTTEAYVVCACRPAHILGTTVRRTHAAVDPNVWIFGPTGHPPAFQGATAAQQASHKGAAAVWRLQCVPVGPAPAQHWIEAWPDYRRDPGNNNNNNNTNDNSTSKRVPTLHPQQQRQDDTLEGWTHDRQHVAKRTRRSDDEMQL